MHCIRLAVRENTLSDPNRITEADYFAALDDLGRTWVIETDGNVVAFATGYKAGSIWALFVHPDYEGLGCVFQSIPVLGHFWCIHGSGVEDKALFQ